METKYESFSPICFSSVNGNVFVMSVGLFVMSVGPVMMLTQENVLDMKVGFLF